MSQISLEIALQDGRRLQTSCRARPVSSGNPNPNLRSIDLAISGTTDDQALLAAMELGISEAQKVILAFPGGERIEGAYYFNDLRLTPVLPSSMGFEATIHSHGKQTRTPARSRARE